MRVGCWYEGGNTICVPKVADVVPTTHTSATYWWKLITLMRL